MLNMAFTKRNELEWSQLIFIFRLVAFFTLTALLPITALAQESQKLGQIIIQGEVSISRPFGEKPIKTGITGLEASLEPAWVLGGTRNMQLRYKLWTLVGEPVWTFAAKVPELKTITLRRGTNNVLYIKRNPYLPSGAVSWQAGSNQITVAPDVMAKACIYDFAMHLPFDQRALEVLPKAFRGKSELDGVSLIASGFPSIYRPFPGIMGVAGQWSWDVPGSPNWDNLFRSTKLLTPDFTSASYSHGAYDAETSKAIMRRLLYAHGVRKIKVIPSITAKVGDVKFTMHDLLFEIRRQHPKALDPIYGVWNDEDRALANIVSAFENDFYAQGSTPAMKAEARKIDALVREFQQELSPSITSLWRNVIDNVNQPQTIDSSHKVIGDVAKLFQNSSVAPLEEADEDTLKSIRVVSDEVDALPSSDSILNVRKLEIKRALNVLRMHSQGPEVALTAYYDRAIDKYGYKDPSGAVVIEPQFDLAGKFYFGHAHVRINNNDRYLNNYLIDKTGKPVLGPFYGMKDLGEYDLLAVSKDRYENFWSYVDLNGKTVLEGFESAHKFVNGFALVIFKGESRQPTHGFSVGTTKPKYFIDRSGKRKFGPFQRAEDFSHGFALVQLGYEDYRYLKADGSYMGRYTDARSFHESGFAAVERLDGRYSKWGIINTKGEIIIPLNYSEPSIRYSDTGEVEFWVVVERVKTGSCLSAVFEEYSQRFNVKGELTSGKVLTNRRVGELCLRGG